MTAPERVKRGAGLSGFDAHTCAFPPIYMTPPRCCLIRTFIGRNRKLECSDRL
jgi:hypothetical protein